MPVICNSSSVFIEISGTSKELYWREYTSEIYLGDVLRDDVVMSFIINTILPGPHIFSLTLQSDWQLLFLVSSILSQNNEKSHWETVQSLIKIHNIRTILPNFPIFYSKMMKIVYFLNLIPAISLNLNIFSPLYKQGHSFWESGRF